MGGIACAHGPLSLLPRTAVTGAISPSARQDFGRADVAGVDDAVDAAQGGDRLGPQQAVRVGDDAEEHAQPHR